MQNVLGIWSGLDPRRRSIAILAAAAVFFGVLLLSQFAASPRLALLYAGVEGRSAGDVVAAIDQEGAVYEIRGTSIYVEAARRDELRMILAGKGLPQNGGSGYELLDGLSGFGTTSQMFDAAYWRAKEGELARTIVASPQIRSARVHISNVTSRGFRRDLVPTASVFVTPAGARLSEAQGRALRFLVASAVSGLKPEDVAVIDGESGTVLGAGEDQPSATAGKREQDLKRNVERLLEARVGVGNAIVEVSLESVTERESIVERSFDPDSRVAVSTDNEERVNSSSGTTGSAVTVASNLPDGEGAGGTQGSSSQNSETRERINFEVSETQREVVKVPGAVKRISVAVLLNGVRDQDESGQETIVPRSDEELEALRALIAAAVGFDENRGDQITIDSLAFEPLEIEGSTAATGFLNHLDIMTMVQVLVLAVVVLVLGLFVLRPILTRRGEAATAPLAVAPPSVPDARNGQAATSVPALTGEVDDGPSGASVVPYAGPAGLPSATGNDAGRTRLADAQDPVARLRQMIQERQKETVEVLRTWMEEDRERT